MDLPTKFRAAIADRYEIECPIAEGSMGAIFLANDLRHRRRVAVKVLRPDAITPLSDVRFVREIRFLAHLQHPNILALYDSGHSEGFLYYVMPYVQGETLRARMSRETRLPPREAVRIACQVGSALDYAHRHGVIHRDIKPENILLSASHVMLMDFGIARAIGLAAGEQLTAPLSVGPGTPAYMSPEQLIPGQELDGRSDIYSLATVIFEMLTGELPFTAEGGRAFDTRKLTAPAPRVRSLNKEVPAAIDVAVARALSPLPGDRFGSASEFANALEATIVTPVSYPATDDVAGEAGLAARTGIRGATMRRALVGLLVVAVLTVLIAAAMLGR
jgi:serine/threonine-protein kinase